MTDVNPCPFCWEETNIDYGIMHGTMSGFSYVKCEECGAELRERGTVEEAIKSWNYKSELAIAAIKKQVPLLVKEIHCDEYYCPACGAENNCDQFIVYDNYCPQCGQKLFLPLQNKP